MAEHSMVDVLSISERRTETAQEASPDDVSSRPVELGEHVTTERLKSVLEYLYRETMKSDHKMAAHLIGVAAASLEHP